MTQHTKGPWEVVNLNHLGPHAIRMHYSDGKTFYGVRQIHREADARLIAAAPELLEALRRARRTVQWAVYNHDVGTPYRKTEEAILAQIDAAIAKAVQS